MEALVMNLLDSCNVVSATNIPDINFIPKELIQIDTITCERGTCNYGGIFFNITEAIKIGRYLFIGEQIKKEMRLMLESNDTDTTWIIKMYESENNKYVRRYTLNKTQCEKVDFIKYLTLWLKSKL